MGSKKLQMIQISHNSKALQSNVIISLGELVKSLKPPGVKHLVPRASSTLTLGAKRPSSAIAKPSVEPTDQSKQQGISLCIENTPLSHRNANLLLEILAKGTSLKSLSLSNVGLLLIQK